MPGPGQRILADIWDEALRRSLSIAHQFSILTGAGQNATESCSWSKSWNSGDDGLGPSVFWKCSNFFATDGAEAAPGTAAPDLRLTKSLVVVVVVPRTRTRPQLVPDACREHPINVSGLEM